MGEHVERGGARAVVVVNKIIGAKTLDPLAMLVTRVACRRRRSTLVVRERDGAGSGVLSTGWLAVRLVTHGGSVGSGLREGNRLLAWTLSVRVE
jgi:hypothetical protein